MAKTSSLIGKNVQRKSAELPWLFRFNVNGKTYSGETHLHDRKKAEAFVKAHKAAVLSEARKHDVLGLNGKITYGAACDIWWQEQGRHGKVRGGEATFTWLRAQLPENLLVQDIRASHVTHVREARRDTERLCPVSGTRKVVASTVNQTLNKLRAILNHVRLHHNAPLAPIAWGAIMLEVQAHEIRVLTSDELRALIGALRPDLRDVVGFALASAKRIDEILSLTWGQISWDMAHPTMRLVTKGGKPMLDPLGPTELDILRRQLAHQVGPNGEQPAKDARVFTFVATRTQRVAGGKLVAGQRYPIVYNMLHFRFDAVVKELGLEGVTIHVLRHTAATLMLRGGVPIENVSRALNHANIAVTLKHYAKVSATEVRGAKDAIADTVAAELQRASHPPLKLVAPQR
jgi:integrase